MLLTLMSVQTLDNPPDILKINKNFGILVAFFKLQKSFQSIVKAIRSIHVLYSRSYNRSYNRFMWATEQHFIVDSFRNWSNVKWRTIPLLVVPNLDFSNWFTPWPDVNHENQNVALSVMSFCMLSVHEPHWAGQSFSESGECVSLGFRTAEEGH